MHGNEIPKCRAHVREMPYFFNNFQQTGAVSNITIYNYLILSFPRPLLRSDRSAEDSPNGCGLLLQKIRAPSREQRRRFTSPISHSVGLAQVRSSFRDFAPNTSIGLVHTPLQVHRVSPERLSQLPTDAPTNPTFGYSGGTCCDSLVTGNFPIRHILPLSFCESCMPDLARYSSDWGYPLRITTSLPQATSQTGDRFTSHWAGRSYRSP